MLLSIGDQVGPGTYRFHSRFNRVVNFEDGGRLIAVVDEAVGPGPLNIVLRALPAGVPPLQSDPPDRPYHAFDRAGEGRARLSSARRPVVWGNPRRAEDRRALPADLLLKVGQATLAFAGHRYRFTSRHRYRSTLDLPGADLHRFQRNLSALGESLKEAAPPKSLALLLDSNRRKYFRGGFERAFAHQILRGVHEVFHGKLLNGIQRLKGCGFGLTPAGDDFIAGFLIGLHILQKLRGQNLQPTRDAIFRAARGDSVFSNTFLDLARRGLLYGRIKDLLLALTSGSRSSVRKAALALFAVGETSGADLATGLFMSLDGDIASINRSARLRLPTTAHPSEHPTLRCWQRAGR
jgi:hypothetical protein